MVEISRDGKRVYWTNSLYSTWDDQFYPGDEGGDGHGQCRRKRWPELDKDFYVEFPEGYRSHQIRLEGGDCSTDSHSAIRRSEGCRILGFDDRTAASLWLAVVGSGIYHGVNPGMGWPLAVSAG
jgi:hypothetical protein